VLKLLEREPLNRYQTAADAVAALDSALGIVPVRGEHLFTLAGGSPRGVQGSEPELASTRSRGQNTPLPAFELPSSDLVSDPEASPPPLPELDPKTLPAPPRLDALDTGLKAHRAGGPRELIEKACERIDAQRARLPPKVRAVLRDVPSSALLLVFLLAVAGSVGTLAVVAVARPGVASKPHASVAVPPRQLEAARTSAVVSSPATTESAPPRVPGETRPKRPALEGLTPTALEELAGRFPEDTKVVLALSRAYLEQREYEKAVATVGRALGMDAKLREEPALSNTLFQTAQEKASVDASFALLEGPMQSEGARIIYELAISDGVAAAVQRRAEAWLDTKAFQRLSSPELNIAVALRNAKSCVERRGLLMRARNVCDDRSLPYLREFQNTTG
jgi:hypothetical protein